MAIDIIARGMAANAEGGGGGSTSWSDITGKPSTFPPSSHTHTTSDISDIDTAIESAIASSSAVSDIEDDVAALSSAVADKADASSVEALSSAVDAVEDSVAALSSAVEDIEDAVVIADTSTAGLVKPDGTTITVAADGTISAVGGSGSDEVFVATYGTTTKAELDAAHQAGKAIFVDFDGSNLPLIKYQNTEAAYSIAYEFSGIDNASYPNMTDVRLTGDGRWLNTTSIGIEITGEKKNAISGTGSTSYYPTTKAVVDYVASQVPDVATTSAAGIVQPDGTSITVNNGVISATGGGADIAYGTSDLQDGESPLATGTLYCFYTE